MNGGQSYFVCARGDMRNIIWKTDIHHAAGL